MPQASPVLGMAVALLTIVGAQDPQELLAQAHQALARGENAQALSLASSALVDRPEDARFLMARSLAHYRLGDTAQAEADLTAALRAPRPDDAPAGDFHWPQDFLQWVSTVQAAYAPDTALPDISLAELNTAAPSREVTAHFVMDVEVVRIPVIVERGNDFMSGLQADDFAVVDGDALPQPIRELIPENEPTSIGILVDAGDGMEEYAAGAVDAVSQILEALLPEDEVFLAQFGDEARFLSDFTTDRVALAAAMAGYEPGAGRAVHDALAMGLIRMRSARFEKKALIVLANGDDISSETTGDEVLLAARREGVAVHTLVLIPEARRWRPVYVEDTRGSSTDGPGAEDTEEPPASDADPAAAANDEIGPGNAALLQEIAHNTGGLVALRPAAEAQFGGFEGWLARACQDLSDYINNQYLILYRSTRPPARGVWRELRIDVGPRHDRVRARSGYVR